jgi:Holliday junction DNA helicase RuvA
LIGRIRGKLVEKQPPDILVEVNGVCYEVQVPMTTAYRLPEIGKDIQLHTHFVVREDAQLLYGFHQQQDKDMFRALIKVNGVGPKMALAILSGMEADDFVRTVQNNDVSAMVSMPGIGKKTAERLIVEMRDRLSEWQAAGDPMVSAAALCGGSSFARDAETALLALGYKPQQAARAVSAVLKGNPDVADSEALIRLALKSML